MATAGLAASDVARGLVPRMAASDHLMVGGIPQEPPGFLPRPDLLAELDRVGDAMPAVHVLTGLPGAGTTQLAAAYARAKLAAGWRLVAWVNAENNEVPPGRAG